MKRRLNIFLLLVVLAAASCSQRRISREDMSAIFHDMFLQDQVVRQNRDLRRQTDTSLVYEGIFQKYGYTTRDYLYSIRHYIEEPEKLAKIMDRAEEMLTKEAEQTKALIEFLDWKEKLMAIYNMQPDTLLPEVPPPPVDSLRVKFRRDSVFIDYPADTLVPPCFPADSL